MDVTEALGVVLSSYLCRVHEGRFYTLMRVSNVQFLQGDIILLWANLCLDREVYGFKSEYCVSVSQEDFYALASSQRVMSYLGKLFLSDRFLNGEHV